MISTALSFLAKTLPPTAMASAGQGLRSFSLKVGHIQIIFEYSLKP